jgi:hypothetical protein
MQQRTQPRTRLRASSFALPFAVVFVVFVGFAAHRRFDPQALAAL